MMSWALRRFLKKRSWRSKTKNLREGGQKIVKKRNTVKKPKKITPLGDDLNLSERESLSMGYRGGGGKTLLKGIT